MNLLKKYLVRIKESRWFDYISNKYVLVTAALLVWLLFFDQNSFMNYASVKYDNFMNHRMIRKLNADIRTTDEKLRELDSDLDSLEKFAREQYFFHKENETVFVVETE